MRLKLQTFNFIIWKRKLCQRRFILNVEKPLLLLLWRIQINGWNFWLSLNIFILKIYNFIFIWCISVTIPWATFSIQGIFSSWSVLFPFLLEKSIFNRILYSFFLPTDELYAWNILLFSKILLPRSCGWEILQGKFKILIFKWKLRNGINKYKYWYFR